MALEQPNLSFSRCMGNTFRQCIAHTFSRKDINETIMLKSHLLETQKRSIEAFGEYLLIAQDTTCYNYTGHKSMEGLGIIQQKTLGILQHNVLVMNEKGNPLGLIYQKYWSRSNDQITTIKPYDEKGEQKESQKWLDGLCSVNEHLKDIEKTKVLIQDREADIYDFFKAEREEKVELITRIFQNRKYSVAREKTKKTEKKGKIVGKIDSMSEIEEETEEEKIFALKSLHKIEENFTTYGEKTITIQRNNKDVQLTLTIKSVPVNILDPNGKKESSISGMTLLVAQEKNPISEKDKICWYLLTSLPVKNQEDAFRIITFYGFRWRIERLHFTLKSGAYNVEKLQFDDIQTTINALTFYSVVSWKLLFISYLLKDDKEYTPETVFDKQEIEILTNLSQQEPLTLKQAVLCLAKLVGFVPTKKQPMPGIKILAEALDRFHYIKIGFKNAGNKDKSK